MDQQHILVVESNRVGRLMFEMQLQQAGYAVTAVESGEAALDLLSAERYDLLLTELLLPSMSGMQLIGEARALDSRMGVIITTGTASTASAIAALNQQVQRYLVKPVPQYDLLCNVAAVLAQRRQIAERAEPYSPYRSDLAQASIFRVGPLKIDCDRHRVTHQCKPLNLSNTEFALLTYFVKRRGAVISPQELVRNVLHYSCSIQEARDLARSLVHRLRRKIEPTPASPHLIQTVRGVGYRLLDEDELSPNNDVSH